MLASINIFVLFIALAQVPSLVDSFAPRQAFTTIRHPAVSPYTAFNGISANKPLLRQPRSVQQSATRAHFIQVLIAASCALSVFYYVWTNIDEIKAKQEIAAKQALTKQSADIRSAQELQRKAIEDAQRKQQEAIDKINNKR